MTYSDSRSSRRICNRPGRCTSRCLSGSRIRPPVHTDPWCTRWYLKTRNRKQGDSVLPGPVATESAGAAPSKKYFRPPGRKLSTIVSSCSLGMHSICPLTKVLALCLVNCAYGAGVTGNWIPSWMLNWFVITKNRYIWWLMKANKLLMDFVG